MFLKIHILLNNQLNSIENILFIIRYFKMYHNFCTPDIFNTKISHQFFEYKITFVLSQPEKTNSKGCVLKPSFKHSD